MTLLLWLIGLFAPAVKVDAGLAIPFQQAVAAWHPHHASVVKVGWCMEDECEFLNRSEIAGLWKEQERQIIISPTTRPDTLRVLLIHEYGHALGLAHRDGYSVMSTHWDSPYPETPTPADMAAARAVRDGKAARAVF